MLKVGDIAPDFTLYNSEKKQITLSQQRGHTVVLLFFPLAFTSTCTKELCSVRDNIGWYNEADARVFGISVDALHTLARYKAEQQLNFDLLSDFNKEVSRAYDTLHELWAYNMKGVSKRSAFVIDKNGKVRYVEVLKNDSDIPDFPAVMAAIETVNQIFS